MSVHGLSTAVLVAHWIIVVGLGVRVILRRPPVGVAMAWLAVILSVPFLGAAVYLLFGEKRLGLSRAALIGANLEPVGAWQRTMRARFDASARIPAGAEPLARLTEHVLGFPVVAGNGIELLGDFQTIFDRMVADIDEARSSVHLCFYIWHEGGRADDVIAALIRAARRGVQCRVLADGLGSRAFLAGGAAARLRAEGVELTPALPTGAVRTLFVRRDLRNHRKIGVIDGRIAWAGSQNLVDPRYFKQESGVGEWVDAMVRITGPAAEALDGVFRFDRAVEIGARFEAPPPFADAAATGSCAVQIAPSGPAIRTEAIHQLLLTAFYAARRELVMTTPYFVPDEAMLTALLSAALRGVNVTLVVPARNDSALVRYASEATFDDLLSAGARIALFRGGLLHTKSLAIDGDMSVFGSVNLDMRSLWLNFEISLLVYDRDFTRRIRGLQDRYLADCDMLELAVWRKRPAWRRFAEDTCRLVGPVL